MIAMMYRKTECGTWAEWKKLGSDLKRSRLEIMRLHKLDIRNKSKKGKWRTATKHIDELRNKLDDLVFHFFPEKDRDELVGVFYGSEDESDIKYLPFFVMRAGENFFICPLCGKQNFHDPVLRPEYRASHCPCWKPSGYIIASASCG